MKYPAAQSAPSVPRSRKDDHLQMGYPMPPKRPGVGNVVSVEGDTCTVNILDEEIPYCIPLTTMPPVDAVVEVEARGDLMVILDWTYGKKVSQEDQALGGWYFVADESPDWQEDYQDADEDTGDEAGEHVWNTTPSVPGTLWNEQALDINPDDTFTFAADFDQLSSETVVTVQLVVNWAAVNADPQPSRGEVVAYGDIYTIDGANIPLETTLTAPDTFEKPNGKVLTVGSGRIGLRFEVAP